MDQQVSRRSITMYPKQWEACEAYAQEEGFSLSLAMRKIVDEWQKLRVHVLVDSSAPYHATRED